MIALLQQNIYSFFYILHYFLKSFRHADKLLLNYNANLLFCVEASQILSMKMLCQNALPIDRISKMTYNENPRSRGISSVLYLLL